VNFWTAEKKDAEEKKNYVRKRADAKKNRISYHSKEKGKASTLGEEDNGSFPMKK